jgi:adenine phosphoribosyltransferase
LQDRIEALQKRIRDVADFPKKGIVFKDITPLLGDAAAFREAIDLLTSLVEGAKIDAVVAIESRGFILGAPVADRLKVGFVPVRKPGKLPAPVRKVSYALEYGTDSLEIHQDAIRPGARVVVVDDVLATGGTARAVGELVGGLGGTVEAFVFLIELTFLGGRERLAGHTVRSLLSY